MEGEVARLGARGIEARRRGWSARRPAMALFELGSTHAREEGEGEGKTDTAPGKGIRTRLHVCAESEDRRRPTRGVAGSRSRQAQ